MSFVKNNLREIEAQIDETDYSFSPWDAALCGGGSPEHYVDLCRQGKLAYIEAGGQYFISVPDFYRMLAA